MSREGILFLLVRGWALFGIGERPVQRCPRWLSKRLVWLFTAKTLFFHSNAVKKVDFVVIHNKNGYFHSIAVKKRPFCCERSCGATMLPCPGGSVYLLIAKTAFTPI